MKALIANSRIVVAKSNTETRDEHTRFLGLPITQLKTRYGCSLSFRQSYKWCDKVYVLEWSSRFFESFPYYHVGPQLLAIRFNDFQLFLQLFVSIEELGRKIRSTLVDTCRGIFARN